MTIPRLPRTLRTFLKNPRFLILAMGGTFAAAQFGEPLLVAGWLGAVIAFPTVYIFMWNRRQRARTTAEAPPAGQEHSSTPR